ncbi:MAG: quinone-dependent dihydroorotate dehydrogenase [Verrucomicrobiales bacterium]|nr:quinone-dependent dihydroorotate dehydrogenase [Verrucomicrobiales bacterium]
MGRLYRGLLRPILFLQDSEQIHNRTLRALGVAGRSAILRGALRSLYGAPALPLSLFGLSFPNPVGLAAGMDKKGEAIPTWASLGLGFSELGGVTRHAQPGNELPRMFRVIPELGLINRMGFNNPGAEAFAGALEAWRARGAWPEHPVGVNLGKSKVTPLDEAASDYAYSFRRLFHLADFFVVNVSSPNTPNLRKLQDKAALDEILVALNNVRRELGRPDKPLLVKVAPDLTFEALDEIMELVAARGLSGVVATNTTITRPTSPDPGCQRLYGETGGLSGAPLRQRSTEVIRHLYRSTSGRMPIIGVGGIFTAADAWEKITAGASLVQVYSGMVYEGPGIARDIVSGLVDRLASAGFSTLAEAVGSAVRGT